MKRSPLKGTTGLRRVALKRTKPVRAHRKPAMATPAMFAYKEVRWGACTVCGAVGMIRRHHVVLEQHVRAEQGDPWDLRNALWIGAFDYVCRCHSRHHHQPARGDTRIPLSLVPDAAFEFAVDLFASKPFPDAYAADYMCSHYRGDDGREMEGWQP